MKADGKKVLIVAGVLEILLGVGAFFMTRWILGQAESGVVNGVMVSGKEAVGELIITYALCAVDVIAGVVAILLAGKPQKYLTLFIFGFALLSLSIIRMNNSAHDAITFISNYVMLLVPAIYIYGAMKNKVAAQQSIEDSKK